MSQLLVMRLNEWTQNTKTIREFIDMAEAMSGGKSQKVVYAEDSDGHPCFYVDVPERASKALERKRKPKAPTKAQQAVRDQLESRRKAVESGEDVPGHVAPVVKNGRVRVRVRH